MSTMGKTTDILSKRMKVKVMCEEGEEQTLVSMRHIKDDEDENVPTVCLFDNYEDVDALKTRVQNSTNDSCDSNSMQSDSWKPDDSGRDLRENGCINIPQSNKDGESDASHSISSSDTILCTEGIEGQGIDESDSSMIIESRNANHLHESETETVQENNMLLGPEINHNGHITKGIKSGLVMSPVSLTQDMPVAVGDTSSTNRLSSVLENMSLPLLYIPTTKQLVSGHNDASSKLHGSSVLSDCQSDSSLKTPNGDSSCNKSEHSQSTDANSQNIDPGTPSGSEGSAGCVPELHGMREPDQLTLHSVDCLIPQVNVGEGLLRGYTDVSSLSSISTGTDFSLSAASLGDEGGESQSISLDMEDGGFMDVNLHSRNSYERSRNISQDSGIEDKGGKQKRKTLSGFLSRNLFSRKAKENVGSESAPGWKLFGRIPPKAVTEKDPAQISTDYQAKQRANVNFPTNRVKKQDIEVLSTTALILENRPMNLPAKTPEEAERHRQQYESMVEAAKKKEQKEMRQKKRQLQKQLKQEDQLVAAARFWNAEILPNWEMMRTNKKARDLWWLGLPPNVRGKLWKLALGNDLNITHELYEICVSRAEDRIKLMQECNNDSTIEVSIEPPSNKEDSVQVIKLDVSRTFPQLCIFQTGGPYHDLLHSLLGAYACYRPDVGYVQGMSFIAAILLLNMEVADAFVCFANLLNRPCQVTFFRMDEAIMRAYYDTFTEFFKENLPHIHDHFVDQALTPNLYLLDWIFLIYGKSLPLDVACRVWDVYCRDGEEFLIRTALGILKSYEGILINMDFIHLAQFLNRLPEDISSEILFRNIDSIHLNSDKKKFAQVLAFHKECRDGLS